MHAHHVTLWCVSSTTDETLAKVCEKRDEILDRGLKSESYNGHTTQFLGLDELIRAEDHLRKRQAAEAASTAGFGARRYFARFGR